MVRIALYRPSAIDRLAALAALPNARVATYANTHGPIDALGTTDRPQVVVTALRDQRGLPTELFIRRLVTLPIVPYCLTNAHTAPAVEQMAVALGVRRQTIAARLAAAVLPIARALVGWAF